MIRYFTNLIEQSLGRTREATLSVLGISNADLRRHLSEQMNDTLGSEGCFLAPPVFEHTFGWQESEELTLGGLRGNLLTPRLVDTLTNAAGAYQFPSHIHPYVHQIHAWETLLGPTPKSVVITSGTGSGKTECFMVPILNDLIAEHDRSNEQLVGVRALFLYPLNALINSQRERLHAWTQPFKSNIRFCLFNGNTEELADVVRVAQRETPNEILSREEMRKAPAPMLMTNATMLEYMLVRQADAPILQISREKKSLRWIVLDEAHTYVGSQAAELSLLLRRVVQAFGKSAEEIRFVATSATIADRNAEEKLRSYLASLAGVGPDRVVVIGGTRRVPDIPQGAPISRSYADVLAIDADAEVSAERFSALAHHPVAANLRHAIVSNGRPLDLNELVDAVADCIGNAPQAERQREVLGWLDVMTGTRPAAGAQPFAKLRIHMFQRMLHGFWACVDSECSAKPGGMKDWPFGNVYVTQRPHCDCGKPVFELAHCDECKAPHLLAEDRHGVMVQRSPYADDGFEINYEAPTDDESDVPRQTDSGQSRVERFVIGSTVREKDPYVLMGLNFDTGAIDGSGTERKIAVAHEATASCCQCEAPFASAQSGLRQSYLGAPFYVANAVPTVLEFCPDPSQADCDGRSPEELPGRGRKLITFTDSRQGTARMAVRMQQEAERSRLRGLVFETLRNVQARSNAGPQDAFDGDISQLPAMIEQLKKFGLAAQAADLQATLDAHRAGVSPQSACHLSWHDMVKALSSTRDISQSILNYNRYANPELLGTAAAAAVGSTAMARLLLAREYGRRPKNQNSTETLGLVRIGYQGLDRIEKAPAGWLQCKPGPMSAPRDLSANLTLQDWKDFLKVALDFHVRENTFIRLDPTMQRWMGSKFKPKSLRSPTWSGEESNRIKKWPQVRAGVANRLVKLLELGCNLDRTRPGDADLINTFLAKAWEALVNARIIESHEEGFDIALETLTFSLPTQAWVCPVTNRLIDTTFVGLTPYLPHKFRDRDYRCRKVDLPAYSQLSPGADGMSVQSEVRSLVNSNERVQALRAENLWSDISDRTAEGGFYYRTAEHSAQQSSKKLESYEGMFKRGLINVLNCSTTMEMGVDIGGISAVVMNNVPPHPANYLQRAGRAGRRNEARAIGYTLCKGDPHNQRAFRNPTWPFVTAIPAPSITLSSDRIVQRHINSMLLGTFLRSLPDSGEDRLRLTVQWFFAGIDNSVCHHFINWMQSAPDGLEEKVRQLTAGTGIAALPLHSIIDATTDAIRPLQERWITEHANLLQRIEKERRDSPYKRALQMELQRHEAEYLLRDLAGRAFLPGYGFPTDVVSLKAYNIEDYMDRHGQGNVKSREDNIFSLREQPTRGLNIAIREYAPGSQIVIDGRVFRSAGVALHWHSGGRVNEAQKFETAWQCRECGASDVQENPYANNDVCCSQCNTPIPPGDRKEILRPVGFVTDFWEATTNDVSTQKFVRVSRPRIHLDGEMMSMPDSRCGHFRFGHHGKVFYHSSGEHDHGYAVCLTCGRAESMTMNDEVPPALRHDVAHRPVGGLDANNKEKVCAGSGVKRNVHLGYHSATDVFELLLRSPLTGQWLGVKEQDRTIATTLAVAIREAIADELGVASTEMGFGTRQDKDLATGHVRTVIQLFDQVAGGAGFVLTGVPHVVKLLKMAAKKLHCPADCDSVCSSCLASQDSQIEREQIDRKAALAWLEDHEYLSHLILPAEFNAIPGATYCSFGPDRFVREHINRGARAIRVALGGDPQTWDLDHPDFRERVHTWTFKDKLDVKLCLPAGVELSTSNKRSLGFLRRLGVDIVETEGQRTSSAVPVLQLHHDAVTQTLLSLDEAHTVPGEHWLRATGETIWVSSDHFAPLLGRALDTNGWDGRETGTTVVEVLGELNGRLSGLTSRLRDLVGKHSTELAALLRDDFAVEVRYCDRYLRSPWSVMVLGGFLSLFKNDKLERVEIATLKPKEESNGRHIKHDWTIAGVANMEQIMTTWFEAMASVAPQLTLVERTNDLQHGRVLAVTWASGRKTRIILDQGVGYWLPKTQYRDETEFDFSATLETQINRMAEQYKVTNMANGADWKTFIYITNDPA